MSKDTTTTEPAPFDIEDWLADAQLPETTVRVNRYGHLAAQLEQLQVEHDAASRGETGDRRLSGKAPRSFELAQEIKALREQMEGGWLTIRLRGLTGAEMERVQRSKNNQDGTVRSIALQAVEPKMTEAQVKTLRDKIGVGQFTALASAAGEVAFGEVVTPDFSASVSATLAIEGSSSS